MLHMIYTNKELYYSPYYFFLKDKGSHYDLYFSVGNTLAESRENDEKISVPKKKVGKVKSYVKDLLKSYRRKSKSKIKNELEELVNVDGSMSKSKTPILDPHLHPRKTMDQTVSMSRITNDPITRGYRTYYGESYDPMNEIDMSDAFGYEETKNLDGKETYKYYKDELELDSDDAKERTKQQGKDPSGKQDKEKKSGSDMKLTLKEIDRRKMIKMVEDLVLQKQSKKPSGELNDSDIELPNQLKLNLRSIKNQADKNGVSVNKLIKFLKSEQ